MNDNYQFWYEQGNRLADARDYAGAIAAYMKALAAPTTSFTIQYHRRVELWQVVVNLNIESDNPQIWLQHGLLLNRLRSYEESIISFEQALSINPNLVDALYYQGYAFLNLQQPLKAISHYCRILEISPDYPKLQRLGNPIKELGKGEVANFLQAPIAVQAILPVLNINMQTESEDPSIEPADNSFFQGNEYLRQGNYQKAVEIYKGMDKTHPKIKSGVCGMCYSYRFLIKMYWTNYGVALHQSGQLEQAVSAYEKAATIHGSFPQAWYSQGVVLEAMGNPKKAERSYGKALSSVPLYPAAWYRHGIVLEKLGQYENAVKSFQNALHISQVFNNEEIETLARTDLKRISQ